MAIQLSAKTLVQAMGLSGISKSAVSKLEPRTSTSGRATSSSGR
jgi:hypothetical protein